MLYQLHRRPRIPALLQGLALLLPAMLLAQEGAGGAAPANAAPQQTNPAPVQSNPATPAASPKIARVQGIDPSYATVDDRIHVRIANLDAIATDGAELRKLTLYLDGYDLGITPEVVREACWSSTCAGWMPPATPGARCWGRRTATAAPSRSGWATLDSGS